MTDGGEAPRLLTEFEDVLVDLSDGGVEFVVVGAHALARHGVVRATLDLDVLVRPSLANAKRVVAALAIFGAPLAAHGVTEADFSREGVVYQVGVPPARIDVVTSISGVSFDEAWASRVEAQIGGRRVAFLGRDALLLNKRAAGRPKDLADLDELTGRA